MTYEEALKLFNNKEYEDVICGSNLCDYKNTGCSDCKYTHMELIIIEALEKQIPKKPVNYDSVPHSRCPVCNNSVKVFEDAHEYHYCLYCGQALDWSDSE